MLKIVGKHVVASMKARNIETKTVTATAIVGFNVQTSCTNPARNNTRANCRRSGMIIIITLTLQRIKLSYRYCRFLKFTSASSIMLFLYSASHWFTKMLIDAADRLKIRLINQSMFTMTREVGTGSTVMDISAGGLSDVII